MGRPRLYGANGVDTGIADASDPDASPTPVRVAGSATNDGGSPLRDEAATIDNAGSDSIVDPSTITAEPERTPTGRIKQKRGPNKPRDSKPSETTASLGRLLYSLHMMGAAFLKIPELELTSEEANKLGASVRAVTEYYGVSAIPEAAFIWIQLASTCGSIYGPRILAHKINSKKRGPQPVQVINGVETEATFKM